MSLDQKIKVCIRGMSGLLGMRLALALKKQQDITLTAGVVRNDETLKRLLDSPLHDGVWPSDVYLDEPHSVVRKLNESQSRLRFAPADQLNLAKVCDVVIDTSAPGTWKKWEERYRHFGKPVILQSGDYPTGRVISPPQIDTNGNGNLYRQGDCILSALSPLLSALYPILEKVRVHILMQYGQKLNDYPTSQRTNATYLRDDLESQIKEELTRLFKDAEIVMEGVLQVPGLDYYTLTLHLGLKAPLSVKDLKGILSQQPRMLITPAGINSTYEIDHLIREESRAVGIDIPPIVIYSSDFDFSEPRKDDIRMRATVYSRLVAVLPNIDSVRILAGKMSPLDAMKLTDRYAGFGY
jgi:hypothetical protein